MKSTIFTKGFTLFFFAVSITEIAGVFLQNDQLQQVFKPLLMLSLLVLYYFTVEKVNKWYVVALIFSFFGDVLLLDKNNMFLFGIAAFLITQLLYIKIISIRLKKSDLRQKSMAFISFVLFFVMLILFLKEHLGSFLVPVIVYGITISSFGALALLNYLTRKSKTALGLFLGAVLFIGSDTMIALYKFHVPKSFYSVAIMITYISAQYFIFRYMVKDHAFGY